MLKPAILYKEELLKKFSEDIYTERYRFYSGYTYGFELPTIEVKDNHYQFAILEDVSERLIGYLAFSIDTYTNSVYNFGLYSFDEGNITVIWDTYKMLERLIKKHHRIEWRCIGGNHAERGYDHFCKKHNGIKHILHDATKDADGNYVNVFIYEIINKEIKK